MQTAADNLDRLTFFDNRWPVVYVDNHLLALYKPAGLLTQGDRTGDACLLELGKRWIKIRFDKPGNVFLAMVHRLDRPVAGVVLFARTSKAAARLSSQFRERTVQKRYLAVVHGNPSQPSGRLVHHIDRRDRRSLVVPAPTPDSQEACLRYTVLGHAAGSSLVQIDLETGRRHQIRLQLAHLGHPIVGDLRYGAGRPLPERQIALLAHRLEVLHPTRGERLRLTSPLPRGWPWPEASSNERFRPPWDWRDFDAVIHAATGQMAVGD